MSNQTIDEYLRTLPEPTREIVTKVQGRIRRLLPPETTEVISYGVPTFKLNGTYVVYCAGYAKHVSIYPIPRSTTLQERLKPYKAGKGTLRFPLDRPIPYALIDQAVRALLADNRERTAR